jgi:cobalt/nickel transport system ATP-binding protein
MEALKTAPLRLQARGLCYSYPDGTYALKGIDIDIYEGDFIGFLGANGSGKTTLLKALDGIIKNIKGTVTLDGADIKTLSARDIYRKVGLVFQNPDDQLFASTVFDDVAFGPLNMGFDEEDVKRRVQEALKEVEMEHMAGRPIHNLSYGQKKRVCIAGLLAMGQEILLLDEPTAGLDPSGEYKMMGLLTRLNRECKVTIVMATHSVDLIPLFLDRLYILSNGTILKGGAPEEIFTTPEDMKDVRLRLPQVAELIYALKHEDNLPFSRVPLTVGEARREILNMVKKGDL